VEWNCKKIYYMLAPEDEAQNNFENGLTVLDNYFERHGFQQMAQ